MISEPSAVDAVDTPDPHTISETPLSHFIDHCARISNGSFIDYWDFERYCIRNYRDFWREFLFWTSIRFDGDPTLACTSDDCETAIFFPDLRLNYAENILYGQHATDPSKPVLTVYRPEAPPVRVTLGALRDQVESLADNLRQLGVDENTRVALVAQNDDKAVIAALATAALGASFATAPPELAAAPIIDRFVDVEPTILFCHLDNVFPDMAIRTRDKIGEIVRSLPTVSHVIVLDDGALPAQMDRPALRIARLIERTRPLAFSWKRLPFNHPLSMVFTSGTTGKAKCLVHSVGGVLLEHLKEHLFNHDMRPTDRVLIQASTGWVVWNLLVSAIASGAELVLNSRPVSSPDVLWRIVSDEHVTIFVTSPAYLRLCDNNGFVPRDHFDFSSLRSILAMGSILDERHQAWVSAAVKRLAVKTGYGAADASASFYSCNPTLPAYPGRCQSRGLGLDLRSLRTERCGTNEAIGEVVVANPFPSRPIAMLNDPDGTRLHDSYYASNPGYWTQGDLIELTPDGGAILHGRSDGVLNIRGHRLGPGDIYRVVRQFPAVANCLAVALRRPEVPGGEVFVLLVVLRQGEQLTDAFRHDLQNAIRRDLSPAHVPDIIADVPDLPMTHNGKLSERSAADAINGRPISNLHALQNPQCLSAIQDHPALKHDGSGDAATINVTAGAATVDIVASVWERVLKRSPIARDISFFDLGGDSLLAIEILLTLEKELNKPLPVTILYRAATIDALAEAVDNLGKSAPSLLVNLKEGNGGPPLFLVHGLSGYVMELRNLAQRLEFAGAVFGIQANGLADECEPMTDVLAMAASYVAAIRTIQPNGPYLLAGYSLGGLIALEMTRLLDRQGDRVDRLFLIDTPIDEKYWTTSVWLRMLLRRASTHIDTLKKTSSADRTSYVVGRIMGVTGHVIRRFGTKTQARFADFYDANEHPVLRRVLAACIEAAAAYKPQRLLQDICLFAAERGVFRASNPRTIWTPYVGTLTVETVPGDHDSVLRGRDCDGLAAAFSRQLASEPQCGPNPDRRTAQAGSSIIVTKDPPPEMPPGRNARPQEPQRSEGTAAKYELSDRRR